MSVCPGYEADKDLAVLKIVKKASPTSPPTSTSGGDASGLSLPAPFNPITVGTSQNLQVGQRVFAIGNPFGLDQTLTQGIVSGVGRDIRSITGTTIRDVVQTDAAINPGAGWEDIFSSSSFNPRAEHIGAARMASSLFPLRFL